MKKKLMSLMLAAALTISITGCGSKTEETKEKSKGKCEVFECMEKLDSKNTLEQMNETIGFEGKLESETEDYKVYVWDLSEKTSIKSQFMLKYDTATISATYPTEIAPNKADFSKWDEIKSKLDKKETITYDEFVKLVGGDKGVLKQKTSSSLSYSWYNKDGGFLTAYFNAETGKCTMATGRF